MQRLAAAGEALRRRGARDGFGRSLRRRRREAAVRLRRRRLREATAPRWRTRARDAHGLERDGRGDCRARRRRYAPRALGATRGGDVRSVGRIKLDLPGRRTANRCVSEPRRPRVPGSDGEPLPRRSLRPRAALHARRVRESGRGALRAENAYGGRGAVAEEAARAVPRPGPRPLAPLRRRLGVRARRLRRPTLSRARRGGVPRPAARQGRDVSRRLAGPRCVGGLRPPPEHHGQRAEGSGETFRRRGVDGRELQGYSRPLLADLGPRRCSSRVEQCVLGRATPAIAGLWRCGLLPRSLACCGFEPAAVGERGPDAVELFGAALPPGPGEVLVVANFGILHMPASAGDPGSTSTTTTRPPSSTSWTPAPATNAASPTVAATSFS